MAGRGDAFSEFARAFATGKVVRDVQVTAMTFGDLSPDGRFARLVDDVWSSDGRPTEQRARVVSLDSGGEVMLPGGGEFGWTPDGNTLTVDARRNRITVCDPGDGTCDKIRLAIGKGRIKLGGLPYES
ncbi:hypothetical protein [Mumia quercus]|uniref:hypothetical protein n=1 Tax=Mumia quercus TaxID=2976125 RepID=UPI0021D24A26|nr:hypothetical protein [Mumia quercus]